jgi:FMN reductase
MEEKIRIVGIGGSLSKNSTSLAALKLALQGAAEAGAEVELIDVGSLNVPFYSPEGEVPEAARRLADSVYHADGLLWASPLYHGTISGSFKNAIDWLQLLGDRQPAYLTDKVVGLISTAGGAHGVQAVNTMQAIVHALRGISVSRFVPIPRAWQVFGEAGAIKDAQFENQLKLLGGEVVELARRVRHVPVSAVSDLATASAK